MPGVAVAARRVSGCSSPTPTPCAPRSRRTPPSRARAPSSSTPRRSRSSTSPPCACSTSSPTNWPGGRQQLVIAHELGQVGDVLDQQGSATRSDASTQPSTKRSSPCATDERHGRMRSSLTSARRGSTTGWSGERDDLGVHVARGRRGVRGPRRHRRRLRHRHVCLLLLVGVGLRLVLSLAGGVPLHTACHGGGRPGDDRRTGHRADQAGPSAVRFLASSCAYLLGLVRRRSRRATPRGSHGGSARRRRPRRQRCGWPVASRTRPRVLEQDQQRRGVRTEGVAGGRDVVFGEQLADPARRGWLDVDVSSSRPENSTPVDVAGGVLARTRGRGCARCRPR